MYVERIALTIVRWPGARPRGVRFDIRGHCIWMFGHTDSDGKYDILRYELTIR